MNVCPICHDWCGKFIQVTNMHNMIICDFCFRNAPKLSMVKAHLEYVGDKIE